MLDQTEIQEAIESTHYGVPKDARGSEKALDYYVLTQYVVKHPELAKYQDEIFLWATSDHDLHRYFSSLKLEKWMKHKAVQLTKDNNEEFLDALESTAVWKSSLRREKRLAKLLKAFAQLEKVKSNQTEMTLASVARLLISANVKHTVVSSDPLVVALVGISKLAKLINQGSESDAKISALLSKYVFDIKQAKEPSTQDSILQPLAHKALLSVSSALFPKPTLAQLSNHELKSYYTLVSKYRALGRHDANKILSADIASDAGSPLLDLIVDAASNTLSRNATLRKLAHELQIS